MAEPTTPTNYFTGGEGPGFKESVDDEKMRLLRLMAVYGSDAQKIMDDAVARTATASGSDKADIGKGAGASAQAVADSRDAYDQSVALVRRLTQEAATAQRADSLRRQSIEAIYKDSVSGDASLAATADLAIADAAAARAARGRGGGGGGGGGGRGGLGAPDLATIPADLLEHAPERVIGFDQDYYDRTGTAAPPVSIEQSRSMMPWMLDNRRSNVGPPKPVTPTPARETGRRQQRSTPYDTSGTTPARETGRRQGRS